MAGILKGIRAAFGDVEMAPYTLVGEKDGYEERLYPARKWACTTMKGTSQQALVSPMFRALFNYISGKNEPNIRIDMTSPVTTYVEPGAGPTCESTFTMAFLVPEQHQESPPLPLDKNIFIEDRPKLSILTRRFGGYTNEDVITKEGKELGEIIRKNCETEVNFDQYYIVGYDPPFKLFGRRNEIWFVKTKSDEEKKENGEVLEEAKQENEVVKEAKQENEVVKEAKQENEEVKEVKQENNEGAEEAKQENNEGAEAAKQENEGVEAKQENEGAEEAKQENEGAEEAKQENKVPEKVESEGADSNIKKDNEGEKEGKEGKGTEE